MKKYLTEEILNKLGIFELRNLGRDVGISSPTTLRKEELTKEIMSIVNGEKQPTKAKTKQGRPPKSLTSLKEMMNVVIPNIDSDLKDNVEYSFTKNRESSVVAKEFDFDMQKLLYSTGEESNRKVSGVIKLAGEGHAFCYEEGYPSRNNNKNFFLPITMVHRYGLKSGDSLTCFVKEVDKYKPSVVYKIESINNIKEEQYEKENRKDFGSFKAVHSNSLLSLKREIEKEKLPCKLINIFSPMGKGQRVLITHPEGVNVAKSYSFVVDNFNTHMNKMFCLLINERPEDEYDFEENLKNTEIISLRFGDSDVQAISKIKILFSRMKRLAENGQDVFLAITNLKRLIDFYKETVFADSNEFNSNYSAMREVKKLLSLARNLEGAGSITIVSSTSEKLGENVINEMKQVCNSYISLNSKLKNESGCYYDLTESFTLKDELLISKETKAFQQKILSEVNAGNIKQKIKEIENFNLK